MLLPLAGLIFLPYTTFFYVIAYAPIVGVSAFGWIFVAFGVAARHQLVAAAAAARAAATSTDQRRVSPPAAPRRPAS